jgi:tetratricopeptide (TPR) repeat protein
MIPFLIFVGPLVSALSWADVPVAARGQTIALVEKAESALAGDDAGKSIEYLLEAHRLAESANDYVASAVINNRVGEIYEQMGRYQEALTQYEQGMQTIATRQAGAANVVDQALAALRGSTRRLDGDAWPGAAVGR